MYHYGERERTEPWVDPKTWRKFWLRRFFRIAPLYYLVLTGVFAFGQIKGHSGLDLKSYFSHLGFLFGFTPAGLSETFMPDWSLALEMQFYASFPFLMLFARRFGYPVLFFVCCLISAVANALIHYYEGTPAGLLGWYPQPTLLPLKLHVFAVGIMFCGIYFEGAKQLRSGWYWLGFSLFFTTCRSSYMWAMAIGYFCLFAVFQLPKTADKCGHLLSRANQKLQQSQWFHWPAELSYSCYLIHTIVFLTVFRWLVPKPDHPGKLAFLLLVLLMLGLSSVLGVVLHFGIEKPGIRFGKFLIKLLNRK